VDYNGLHLTGFYFRKCDDIAVCILCVAFVWTVWRRNIMALLEKFVFEVKNQFGVQK